MIDRLAPRRRPSGWPVLHQRWHGLVFLHWALPPERLRALVPRGLALDLHEGQAWVGVTPFSVSRIRPSWLPALPVLSRADEVNVRIYVEKDGLPGIWFPGLEISNPLAKWAARMAYGLPYFRAAMRVERRGELVRFASERVDRPSASLDAVWRLGPKVPPPQLGTLEDFLIERYVVYAGGDGTLMRARIHHRPWPLREASVLQLSTTLFEANGLPLPATPVLALAQAAPLDVAVWPPEHV